MHFDIILQNNLLSMVLQTVAYPGIFFGGGSTNSVEDREDRDVGAVAP